MRYGLILSLLISVRCRGQTTTGQAETGGPCSPAVTGSNNQFTIKCQGISKEQGAEFLKILNKISRDQLDPRLVLTKLDEIQINVTAIKSDLEEKKLEETEADRIRRSHQSCLYP